MNTQTNKKPEATISPVTAAIAGAVVGAGLGAAGAIALKDEQTRQKAKEMLSNVKDQANGYIEKAKTASHNKKTEMENKVADSKAKLSSGADGSK